MKIPDYISLSEKSKMPWPFRFGPLRSISDLEFCDQYSVTRKETKRHLLKYNEVYRVS